MTPAELPHDFTALAVVVHLLGWRHGFDADHLAAIDGITRCNAARRPRLARWAGALFSLGHGAVVLTVALGTAALSAAWQVPRWLDAFGAWTSIGVLAALALANMAQVLATPGDARATLVGWRAGWLARWLDARGPAAVLLVGAVFALSFDTLSQATLFAMTARHHGGWQAAGGLGALFVAGMLLADGANGAWIARLLRRSDRRALVASRTMALAVAGVGLLTAGFGAAAQSLDAVAAWANGKELWFGAAVVAIVGASYVAGNRLAARGTA